MDAVGVVHGPKSIGTGVGKAPINAVSMLRAAAVVESTDDDISRTGR
jgi:hypothetical protein